MTNTTPPANQGPDVQKTPPAPQLPTTTTTPPAYQGPIIDADGGADGEIPYNSDDLSSTAYHARGKVGLSPKRNVAVAEVPGWNDPLTGDNVIGFSQGKGYHAEDHILDQLAAAGVDPGSVTALYSERQPCSTCDALLEEVLSPGAHISWSVPWSDDPVFQAAANDALAEMIRKAGGGK